ncbi:MAG: flippase-like domain-containing protein [Saprospiraceae bacterium]|nr:flippase-like domain-containing protein [Saprospiraceae bacterium]MCB0682655.1 flippase-like domain-containing protein [Saprospiraceae bacterium]
MSSEKQGTPKRPKSRFNRFLNGAVFFISLGVLGNLYFTWKTTDFGASFRWEEFSPGYLLLAAALAFMPWVTHMLRLTVWARFLKVKASAVELFRIAVATDLGAAVTPTVVGGAPIKLGMLVQQGFSAGAATMLVAIASFEDVFFMLLIIPVSLALTGRWDSPVVARLLENLSENWPKILLIAGAVVIGAWLLYRLANLLFGRYFRNMRNPILRLFRNKTQKLKEDFRTIARLIRSEGKKAFFLSLLLNTVQWLFRFSILVALVKALGVETNFVEIFLLQWMVFIAMSMVPTPGATGGAEVAFFYVFGNLIPGGIIALVIAGWRFLTYYYIMLMAVVLLQVTRLVGKKKAEPATAN